VQTHRRLDGDTIHLTIPPDAPTLIREPQPEPAREKENLDV